MTGLAELVVVQLDEANHGVIHRVQLHQRHLAVLREKLEGLDLESDVGKCVAEVVLLHGRGDVGQVEGGGGRVDVLVVLGARLLEPVQRAGAKVFGQPSVGLTLLGQLNLEEERIQILRH